MKPTTAPKLHPIRAARMARQWSQQDVGQRLNPPVGKAAVSQWESGATMPVATFAVQLVDLFEGAFTLDDLYRRDEKAVA